MFCDKCGKNHATTHIKTVVNGIVTEQNLCSQCAAGTGFAGNSVSQMFSTLFTSNNFNIQDKKCSVCGCKFSEISKTGKVGCSECYNTFKTELLPYLKRIHGSIKHTGSTPIITTQNCTLKKETVESLKALLVDLIKEENYEQAAVVRDKIKEMEAK